MRHVCKLALPRAAISRARPRLVGFAAASIVIFHRPAVFAAAFSSSPAATPSMMLQSSSSSSMVYKKSLPTTWSDILNKNNSFADNANHYLFPPLVSTTHKGSHGRIAIIGGSDRYCGAPYYAAMAALRCGVDLVTVLCANEASTPIKCYSPELMVHAIYSIAEMDSLLGEEREVLDKMDECKQREQEVMIMMDSLNEQSQIIDDKKENMINTIVNTIITQYFPTIHAVCIGPGLGRHPLVFSIMSRVIQNAMESKLVLVLDADALYMLSLAEYKILLCELLMYDKCVMTPNSMEMKRLTDALSSSSTTPSSTSSLASTNSIVHKLQNNNNIIIQKGVIDTINNYICTMQCKEEGGLKRCGGIGDVLSGSVTAFMAWNAIFEQQKKNTSDATNADDDDDDDNIVQQQQRQQQQRVFACWSASVLVKKATKLAYEKKHRSMSAMNVLDEIGIMIYDMEEGLKQKI